MSPLSELFDEAGSDTINHRGRIVKAVVRVPVRDGAVVKVLRKQVGADRPQGLKLALNDGVLDINTLQARSVVLWSTTSPDEVSLAVRGSSATTLELWNCWSMGGVDTSWIGNAGIVTKTTATGMVLRCSDGIGPAEFSDLEVEVAVER
jgi:hypothetical protein